MITSMHKICKLIVLIFIYLLIGIFNLANGQTPSINATQVNLPNLCDSVDFHQIPNNPNYFIGRRLINTSSDICSGSTWTLSLFEMNWDTNTITYVRDVIGIPTVLPSQNGTVESAYDPTIISFNGELWIAFECAGTGTQLTGSTSSCIAPLSASDYSVTTARMAVVVAGIPPTTSADGYSASVPKIFLYDGTPYLYWSVSHFSHGIDGLLLTDTTTRGAMLTQEPSGLKRLWISGSTGASTQSVNNRFNYEVLGVDPSNALSNNVADSFDVQVVNGQVLLNAAIGGKSCLTSLEPSFGCYRLEIRSSSTPLGTHIFNSSILESPTLAFNPQQYSKIVTDPSGNKFILGYYENPASTGSPNPPNTIASGMMRYPINIDSLKFSAVDNTPTPSPTNTSETLSPSFDVLQQFVSSCSRNNPIPNSSNFACFSAVNRYCSSQGYSAGGILEEYAGDATATTCVSGGSANSLYVDVSVLSGYQSSCTINNLVSGACASAIGSYCRSQGYPSDGFGPMEASATGILATCMSNKVASVIQTSFTALSAQQSSCTLPSWTSSGACYSAVSRVCQASGYYSGYGIMDYNQNVVLIGCVRNGVIN